MVPSQKASTSSSLMPADCKAALDESISRSSVERFQCSPKVVHPIPTMATWSRIPRDAMSTLLVVRTDGPCFPEVIMHAVLCIQPAEGHLDAIADGDGVRVDVGELALEPTT